MSIITMTITINTMITIITIITRTATSHVEATCRWSSDATAGMLCCKHVEPFHYIYIYIYIHTHMYIYIYIHTYIHTYVYIYIYSKHQDHCAGLYSLPEPRIPDASKHACAWYRLNHWTYENTVKRKDGNMVIWHILICHTVIVVVW